MKKVTKANEDYLEAILKLGGDTGGVKSVGVAKLLGVSKPAVTLATNNLLESGLIKKASYGEITLTEKGAAIAEDILIKHNFIKSFLTTIGVSESKAEIECCKMEHHLSDETVDCLRKFCTAHGIEV